MHRLSFVQVKEEFPDDLDHASLGSCSAASHTNDENSLEPPAQKFKHGLDDDTVTTQNYGSVPDPPQSSAEVFLMSFFKGISPDVLSLSAKNQRLFKRKIVEIVSDLHDEEECT